jgi:hypothetical protein
MKKQFEYELSMFMNFEGVELKETTIGSFGQKCYWFSINGLDTLDKFDVRMQCSCLLNLKSSSFYFSVLNHREVLIINSFLRNF